MYNYTSALFSNASNARSWESCDCERNVKEERVFTLDSYSVPGDDNGYLSASFKFVGPNYKSESVPALRAAVQVLLDVAPHDAAIWGISHRAIDWHHLHSSCV